MMLTRPVLWVDPGKDTGLALFQPQNLPEASTVVLEEQFMQAGDRVESICGYYGRTLLVGWERFTIFPSTPPADAHHAIEMIGVVRRSAMEWGCQILTPAAPGDRNVATPAMLKELGWWIPGHDDAQSAAQHLLAWMLRERCAPAWVNGRLASLRGNDAQDILQ
jgi:hypothetical protein